MVKVVIVAGANSGLGKAFAMALLQANFKVVGAVRKQEAAEQFERLQPGAAVARVLDVTDAAEQIAAFVADIEQNLGPFYALINNAEYGQEGTLEETSMDELRQQFEVKCLRIRFTGQRRTLSELGRDGSGCISAYSWTSFCS